MGREGPLAALIVGHRPLRVCFLRAPCQSNPSLPNRTPLHFQTGSWACGERKGRLGGVDRGVSALLSQRWNFSLGIAALGFHCELKPQGTPPTGTVQGLGDGSLGALRGNSRFGRENGYGFGPFGFESFELRVFGFGALTSGTEFPQWNNPKNRPLRTPSGPDS